MFLQRHDFHKTTTQQKEKKIGGRFKTKWEMLLVLNHRVETLITSGKTDRSFSRERFKISFDCGCPTPVSTYNRIASKQNLVTSHISWPGVVSSPAYACKMYHRDHIWIYFLGEPRILFVFHKLI